MFLPSTQWLFVDPKIHGLFVLHLKELIFHYISTFLGPPHVNFICRKNSKEKKKMGWQDDFGGLWTVYKLQVWGLMLDDTAAEPVDAA